ncbi:MAG TPA: lysophospholipid acyltransferase family protein [Pseudonocardiaceae bacterium]|nr:lysophospholipid acyltransferase family protein [Pseudonocardiaceae bacterium]
MAQARVIPLHGKKKTGNATPGVAQRHALAESSAPEAPAPVPAPERSAPQEVTDRLADFVAFARRRLTGEYEVDEFGFDAELTDNVIIPPLRQLYQKWFRVEVLGTHNLPETGGALLVANHSGTLPLDAMMTAIAVRDNHPAGRYLRMLGADLVFRTPVLGSWARKTGQTLACNADAERLLSEDHLVGVWPEGFKGIGKPFRDRYKLQRFGRGGFVAAALRTGKPIVPCSIVGAEEIYPKIADLKPLARLLGFPYFPVTPLFPLFGPLGAIPLPSKWYIEFGEPIRTDVFGPGAEEDPMLLFNLTDQVRENIQQTLYRLLANRRNVFLG